jgi:formamidopyrimidine-DNA glycosylase
MENGRNMPELPEVFTVAQTLDQNIKGFRIDKVCIKDGFKVGPTEKVFVDTLQKNLIAKISNHAKNIIFELEDGNYLVVHLAMTGQLIFKKINSKASRWERVLFTLTKDGKTLELAYNDMRNSN